LVTAQNSMLSSMSTLIDRHYERATMNLLVCPIGGNFNQ